MNGKDYGAIGEYLMHGDAFGAVEYMKGIPELADIARTYTELFEQENYLRYGLPEEPERILLCYQKYFREVFYLCRNREEAEQRLLETLKRELGPAVRDAGSAEKEMKRCFARYGYCIRCGKTDGYYGPYVWKETVPETYEVELPEAVVLCRVNMLRGVVCRGWMDYLTFGERGTGGWTDADGSVYCVEKAYDKESDRFRVSLLRHEAQHAQDLRRWPGMSVEQLEYRAKLVELIYTKDEGLPEKFFCEADETRTEDGHALAAARLRRELEGAADLAAVRERAKVLFAADCRKMTGRCAAH